MAEVETEDSKHLGVPFAAPDGPNIEVPYIGTTGTFLHPRTDLLDNKTAGVRWGTLQHHVPLDMRGPYKLTRFPGILDEREGPAGYAMCTEYVNQHDKRQNPSGEPRLCRAKAINRSGRCSRHGGMLHPLDRQRIDWDTVPRHIRFKYGRLDVRELDDEELSRGQVRKEDGTFTDNKSVSIQIHDAMVRRLFERADTKLRENLLEAVNTMAEIAKSNSVEPADRIRAATWIYERVRGKVPTEVVVTQDKPFELVLGAVIEGGSRAASRARRGVATEEDMIALDNYVEAEVVEEPSGSVEEPTSLEELDLEESLDARYLEQPVKTPTPLGETAVPPEDPELRDRYEKAKAEEERRVAEERKEFTKRMREERAKRYAARARGLDHVEAYPYKIGFIEDSPEDGPEATKIIWDEPVAPKIPASEEAKETRRRNAERFR